MAPPREQKLRYIIGADPSSLDPAYYDGGFCYYIVPQLFESLAGYHP